LDFKKHLKTNKNSLHDNFYKDPLFILILITASVTFYLLNVQIRIGVPYWDVFNYLNNALYFASMGNGGVLYLPPLIPILTSIFFRFGYISQNAIFIVDSIIFIIGLIGFYLLLNQRFNKKQSFTGSIIFLSLPVVMPWIASGGIDIPAISFSIWAILFTVLGVKKNSKFFYLVLPLIMISFLTRYTSGLILVPILFYSLINIKNIRNIKIIFLGVLLEALIMISAFLYFYHNLGTIDSFYALLVNVITFTSKGIGDVAYNPNKLYYIQNILNYISFSPFQGTYDQLLNPSRGNPSILSYITAIIALIGLSFYIYRILNSRFNNTNVLEKKLTIKLILMVALITGFMISSINMQYSLSVLIFFFICVVIHKLLKNSKRKSFNMDLMIFSWFGAYLIFQSTLGVKVDRYFITMAPALVYFILLGLSEFMNIIRPEIKNQNLKSWGIYLIIALLFLSTSTATYIGHTPKKCFTKDIESASNWLKVYDPNYSDKIITSDYPNSVSWYLKKEVRGAFPRFYESSDDFSNALQKKNADYYIDSLSEPKLYLKGYQIINRFGNVVIYRKII